MMLLIEYFTEASEYIRERKLKIQKLQRQFHNVYDHDLKRESIVLLREIQKKKGDVIDELLLNLDEFRALRKYFPELLQVIMEDPYIGPVVSKKDWLLDFKPVKSENAQAKFQELISWRMQVKAARKSLRGWVGKVNANSMVTNFPILRGYIKDGMTKADALDEIKKVENTVLREGWFLLISDSLIKIPIAKFLARVRRYTYEEEEAKKQLERVGGRGTIAEAAAKRKLEDAEQKRSRYVRLLRQILLANPSYLRQIKQKKNWLSREQATGLEKFARDVTPHALKERAWLDEMKHKFG